LWEGPGSEGEAGDACRRLVTTLASALPGGGVILDAGNGLGTQDPLVAEVVSLEAAFHFLSREAFFEECYRGLRPGGVLSISDIPVQRWPVTPAELLAGLTQLRVFGLRPSMAMTGGQIAAAARAAGLGEAEVTVCGDRVIAPALRLAAARLAEPTAPGHDPPGDPGVVPASARICRRQESSR
jgi:SAM-dependent methyltransferase